jgi:putative intracellular protease/amidase
MKQQVLFMLLEPYSDWEVAYLSSLLCALGSEQYEVKTVATDKKGVRSMGNFLVLPDYDIAAALKESRVAGLVLVGGMSWRLPQAEAVLPLVEKAVAADWVLGAICDGTVFLGRHGFLNDKKHTSNDPEDLKAFAGDIYLGAGLYQTEPATRDGKLITANGTAPLEFMREVLSALAVAPPEKINCWYEFHKYGSLKVAMPEI